MSWWESAYRSGHVPWDPGAYDGHLPWVLETFDIAPCSTLDAGCGNGKSAVWLARQGFPVVGIDLSQSAVQQARRLARRHGVAELTSFYVGGFPAHLPRDQGEPVIRPGGFGFVTERAFLQHVGHGRSVERTVEILAACLVPNGIFYSLMIAREGASGHWGITKWSEHEIRAAVEPWFTIREMRRDVFTPGEPGSVPAWITVMSPRANA